MLTRDKYTAATEAMGEAFGLRGRLLVHGLAIEAVSEEVHDTRKETASLQHRLETTEREIAELRQKLGDLL